MKTPSLRCSLVVLLSASFAGPAFAELAEHQGSAPIVSIKEQAPVAAPGPLTDRERFSQREAKAPGLKTFKGGDDGPEIYVGIGGGTLAVILLVVIIIILVH